uniref:Sushi, von Willebrand factor type A, EGF and pentraxin domain-containing protein 1 n=1 Tax=Anthurium amnicola TaxID=1678845 RepID=A0A1D1XNM9_9ARAE
MEYCPTNFSAIGQLYPERISGTRSGMWHMLNPSVHRAEVICPEPKRMIRAPVFADSSDRLYSKTKGAHSGESLGILDIILSRDDSEREFESPSQLSFFCGSPPVRSSNPVIHDAKFDKGTAPEASLENSLRGNPMFARVEKAALASSPLGNSHGGKPLVVKMERTSPSCASSVGGKPKVRIEGFASGKSESNCVVPALA